jgi:hypothetical protein
MSGNLTNRMGLTVDPTKNNAGERTDQIAEAVTLYPPGSPFPERVRRRINSIVSVA